MTIRAARGGPRRPGLCRPRAPYPRRGQGGGLRPPTCEGTRGRRRCWPRATRSARERARGRARPLVRHGAAAGEELRRGALPRETESTSTATDDDGAAAVDASARSTPTARSTACRCAIAPRPISTARSRVAARMTLTAGLGSDDGLEVWLNGEKLLSKDVPRGVGAGPGPRRAPARRRREPPAAQDPQQRRRPRLLLLAAPDPVLHALAPDRPPTSRARRAGCGATSRRRPPRLVPGGRGRRGETRAGRAARSKLSPSTAACCAPSSTECGRAAGAAPTTRAGWTCTRRSTASATPGRARGAGPAALRLGVEDLRGELPGRVQRRRAACRRARLDRSGASPCGARSRRPRRPPQGRAGDRGARRFQPRGPAGQPAAGLRPAAARQAQGQQPEARAAAELAGQLRACRATATTTRSPCSRRSRPTAS